MAQTVSFVSSYSYDISGPRSSRLLGAPTSAQPRSLSVAKDSVLRKTITRSGSTPDFHRKMAAVAAAPGIPRSRFHLDSDSLSTLRDPRSPSDEYLSPQSSATSSPHPDLNVEVATLSNKLISAINHQTHLEDALTVIRQELALSREELGVAKIQNKEYEAQISAGLLIRRKEFDAQLSNSMSRLSEERERTLIVEREKKRIEQELENLTSALFEEANEMVAAARREREASERRNDQLRAQLTDTESLLASHQEQLTELKEVLSQLHESKDELEHTTANSTTPSTPALSSQIEIDKVLETMHMVPTGATDEILPAAPTTFANLITPALRTDLVSYEDFKALLDIPRRSAPSSRVNSGSYGGVAIPGLASSVSVAAVQYTTQGIQSNSSVPSGVSVASPPLYANNSLYIPLKETKFYKRALTEDIEPTLRLDTAPGLSWLVRRTVINSMCEGSLVVEPMPSSTRMSVFSCALCGENRKQSEFARKHRFRTSESENAQRYPLCGFCLNRVRSTCDYISFLRLIKDGHWRAESVEGEKAAWEESVKLRERMFWSRIGGGVIPSFLNAARESSSSLQGASHDHSGSANVARGIPTSALRPILSEEQVDKAPSDIIESPGTKANINSTNDNPKYDMVLKGEDILQDEDQVGKAAQNMKESILSERNECKELTGTRQSNLLDAQASRLALNSDILSSSEKKSVIKNRTNDMEMPGGFD